MIWTDSLLLLEYLNLGIVMGEIFSIVYVES